MRAEGAAHKGGEWVSQSLTTTPFRIPSHSSLKLRSAFLVQSLSHDPVSGTAVGTCSTAASPEHSSRAAGGGGGLPAVPHPPLWSACLGRWGKRQCAPGMPQVPRGCERPSLPAEDPAAARRCNLAVGQPIGGKGCEGAEPTAVMCHTQCPREQPLPVQCPHDQCLCVSPKPTPCKVDSQSNQEPFLCIARVSRKSQARPLARAIPAPSGCVTAGTPV